MKSIGQKIQLLHGLCGTKDVSDWEDNFIDSVYASTREGKNTSSLTEKQLAVIERIYNKHFA